MFTEEALKQNSFLLMNNFKKLIAEVNNAIPDELRICSKLDPRSVMISNGNIVFATSLIPYVSKTFAIIEGRLADGCDTIGNGDGGKGFTIIEGFFPDGGNTARNCKTANLTTVK